jgi:hypothetical protein
MGFTILPNALIDVVCAEDRDPTSSSSILDYMGFTILHNNIQAIHRTTVECIPFFLSPPMNSFVKLFQLIPK